MQRCQLPTWFDRLGIALVAALSLLLRTDLEYRTAFVDEAINLFEGWRMLRGQETYLIHYHMGWPVLSAAPLGLAGWLGGVQAARAINAVWGTMTVLVVMGIARQVYGPLVGYIAGGLYAGYGPAILVSTLATYDSLSILLVSSGLYLCLYGLAGRRRWPYPAAGLAMALAVLAKYAAAPLAAIAAACLALGLLRTGARPAVPAEPRGEPRGRDWLANLALFGLPLLLLPAYGWVVRGPLADVWVGQVLTKQSAEPGARRIVLASFGRLLGLPLLCGLPCLLRHQRWATCFRRDAVLWRDSPRPKVARGAGRLQALSSLLLLAVGLSMMPYQLLNSDSSTLLKHTCYMLVGLAPLAAGGMAAMTSSLLGSRLKRNWLAVSTGVVGLVLIGAVGLSGQRMLPGLRSYWPDTAELMRHLQQTLREGDRVLMEQGAVGRYYLVEKGVRGRIPSEVVDTWWYQDEEGSGEQAYRRAILAQRFDWVVFDYTVSAGLDRELLELMEGRYDPQASFPARLYGQYGTIDVFTVRR